jgi:hypothetical protein
MFAIGEIQPISFSLRIRGISMNFHHRKSKPPLASDVLLNALGEGFEKIGFHVGTKKYLVVVAHDAHSPVLTGNLFVDDEGGWVFLEESGEFYRGEDDPPEWRGLPEILAKAIILAIYLNCKQSNNEQLFPSIDEAECIVLEQVETKKKCTMALEGDFPAEEIMREVLGAATPCRPSATILQLPKSTRCIAPK